MSARDNETGGDVMSYVNGGIRVVRNRLETLGWDCSPDADPMTADYCPDCCQGTHWRH